MKITHGCFNPRTHEGCDLISSNDSLSPYAFQSTHPRRVRPAIVSALSVYYLFQSTHPRRVRQRVVRYQSSKVVFQSTHPRRVRLLKHAYRAVYSFVSIHAPTKGATSKSFNTLRYVSMFQSTHPRRVRLGGKMDIIIQAQFQSTHPRRVRRNVYVSSG